MGQSGLTPAAAVFAPESETALLDLAARVACAWRARASAPLLVGLIGDLGAGKTTWVRGMLTGLGYTGRVPSPTYTLLEHYALPGVDLVHLDLYRLGGDDQDADARGELEALGLRDWLATDGCWVLAEWPERSGQLLSRCDIEIRICSGDVADARRVEIVARSALGQPLVEGLHGLYESGSS